jgi:hypothetical protein
MLLTSMFWTRKEQGLRMSFWLMSAGWAQLIGAGVSWGLGHTTGALKPWQLVFLVSETEMICFVKQLKIRHRSLEF